MDWKSFIAAIVDALAWPTLIGIALFTFRKTLHRLFGDLQFDRAKRLTIGAGGLDLEFFDSQMESVDKALSTAGAGSAVTQTSESIAAAYTADEELFKGVLDASPKAAVIESFVRTELAFREIAQKLGYEDADQSELKPLLGWLHREAAIGTDTYEAGLGLLKTRNEVIHANEIDRDRALRFLSLAAQLQLRLKKIELP